MKLHWKTHPPQIEGDISYKNQSWCCSVPQSCLTLCDPMDCSTRGMVMSFTISQSLFKLISIELVIPSNHLILYQPLLLLPSIFSSIRVFSNDSALHIRWPKYWSFNSISPSSECSGRMSFRIELFFSLQLKRKSHIILDPLIDLITLGKLLKLLDTKFSARNEGNNIAYLMESTQQNSGV